MAAHIRQIVWPCSQPGCPKTATHEIYNTRNTPMSRYCSPHAKRALADFIRENPEQA